MFLNKTSKKRCDDDLKVSDFYKTKPLSSFEGNIKIIKFLFMLKQLILIMHNINLQKTSKENCDFDHVTSSY